MTDVLVVADAAHLPESRVWGTPEGGHQQAVDWLTLMRLLGWRVAAIGREYDGRLGDHDIVIVAGDPDGLPAGLRRELHELLDVRARLVVASAGASDGDWRRRSGVARRARAERTDAGGRLSWEGPGPAACWELAAPPGLEPLEVHDDVDVWATLDGQPIIAARRLTSGSVVATLAVDASGARPAAGAVSALLKRLVTCGCPFPTAWLDLEAALLLRMDDPGASANVHLRNWSYAKLGEHDWDAVGAALRMRGARMSVAYTPGWVDDGDAERGALEVDGAAVARKAGAVHPSPLVVHTDRNGHAPGRVNDYRSEFRGIVKLQIAGLAGVELHGYTHMVSDLEGWPQAADRYDEIAWYREFDPSAAPDAASGGTHPVHVGARLLEEHFEIAATTLVCPGQAWTESALEQALVAGLRLVSANGLAVRHGARFCWCAGIPAIYLDKPDPAHLASELPVIGFFHDHELATAGLDWMATQLDAWRRAGVRRFIDFRELAAMLGLRLRLSSAANGEWWLESGGGRGLPLVRPVPVLVHSPAGEPPQRLSLDSGGARRRVKVQRLRDGLGRLVLPAE